MRSLGFRDQLSISNLKSEITNTDRKMGDRKMKAEEGNHECKKQDGATDETRMKHGFGLSWRCCNTK
jgi:hypothetical protein